MTRAFSITPLTARTALSGLMRMIGISVRTLWPAQLAVIVLSAGMVAATARGIEGLYPTEADRAQYAATALPALPLESCSTFFTPIFFACSTKTAAPRSLNESVGIA